MGCEDWPSNMSLSELKSLLGSGIFANITIDCSIGDMRKVHLHFIIYKTKVVNLNQRCDQIIHNHNSTPKGMKV